MCWKLLLLLSFRTSQHPKTKEEEKEEPLADSATIILLQPLFHSQDGMRETESEEGPRTRTITDRPKSTSAQSVLAMLKYVLSLRLVCKKIKGV